MIVFFAALLFAAAPARGQEKAGGSYLIPQTVFVGDRGTLVTPLGEEYAAAKPFIREEGLPESPELRICRLELERRNGEFRLLVTFIAYAPGIIPLPPLILPSSLEEPLVIQGLTVPIASILDNASLELSGRAPPLALPGTSLLLYGSAGVILLLVFLGIGCRLWGRRFLEALSGSLRGRLLLRRTERRLARLEGELAQGKEYRDLLGSLSREFRLFLSGYTGIDCMALTAAEFPSFSQEAGMEGLEALFARWDAFRFNGQALKKETLLLCIAEARSFLKACAAEGRGE